jgi:ribonuclease BN (tRNA processing enzyme)
MRLIYSDPSSCRPQFLLLSRIAAKAVYSAKFSHAARDQRDEKDELGSEINPRVNAHEITAGVVCKDMNVTATAFPTRHAMESFAYRVDTPDRSIVITGDSVPKTNIEDTLPCPEQASQSGHFSRKPCLRWSRSLPA